MLMMHIFKKKIVLIHNPEVAMKANMIFHLEIDVESWRCLMYLFKCQQLPFFPICSIKLHILQYDVT